MTRSLGAFVLACGLTAGVLADQLHVPSEYFTIQSAIDAAANGDEVIVGPGTYSEALRLLGKQIILRSSDGAGATTVLGDFFPGSILVAMDGETPATVVEGLTFSSGQGGALPNCFSTTARVGGAVYIGAGCALTFNSCRFVQNSGVVAGGGVYVHLGGVILNGCEFEGNSASHGGGLYVCRGGAWGVEVSDTLFTGNSAAHGGGINTEDNAPSVIVRRCGFVSNTASHGAGALVRRAGGLTVIEDCVFVDNEASFGAGLNFTLMNTESGAPSEATLRRLTFTSNRSGFGGGIFTQVMSDSGLPGGAPLLRIEDSMFSGNSAGPCCNTGIYSSFCWTDGAGFGGGADVRVNDGHAQVVNCLFTANSAPRGAALSTSTCGQPSFGIDGGTVEVVNCTVAGSTGSGVDLRVGYSGLVKVANGIVRGSSGMEVRQQIKNPVAGQATIAVEYSNIQGGFAGTGNIDSDPMYVNPSVFNFRLGAGSPSIDAGDSGALVGETNTDLGGAPRRMDDLWVPDTGTGGAPVVDMGAYEFQGSSCIADFNGDGFVDGIDSDMFNNDFEAGDISADINGDGFVDGIDYDVFNNVFEAGC